MLFAGVLVISSWVVGGHALESLCAQYASYGFDQYIINNDAWNPTGDGGVCTYVQEDPVNNSFYSIWNWSSTPAEVRAFPHIQFDSKALPVQLQNLYSLNFTASWTLAPTDLESGKSADPTSKYDAKQLEKDGVQADVVVDMFGDLNATKSLLSTEQDYEFMVWFGRFGDKTLPIGNDNQSDSPVVVTTGGIDFTLYQGLNGENATVYTWLADNNYTDFNIDIAPLFGYLVSRDYIPADLYLGTVNFGTETLYTKSTMNFTLTSFGNSIVTANLSEPYNGTTTSTNYTSTLPVAQEVTPTSSSSSCPVSHGWLVLGSLALALSLAL